MGLGGAEGTLEIGQSSLLGGVVLGQLVVHVLGGLSQVGLELKEGGSLLGTELLHVSARLLGELSGLLGSSLLVLLHHLADDTTTGLVGGLVGVGLLDEAVHLGIHLVVDFDLGSVGHNHGGHNLEITEDAGLEVLGLSGGG